MGETATDTRSAAENFFGADVCGGKVYAQNRSVNVEESYPVAYNLGCGNKHWTGWINVDLGDDADLKSDLRTLPIKSDSADAVAAIHVLEHFYHWEVPDVLKEWKRILKPGGKLILELPSMDKVMGYIAQCIAKKEDMERFMTLHAMYGDPMHKDPAMCHKWGWFMRELYAVLDEAGFRDIRYVTPRYHFAFRDQRFEAIK